MELELHEYQASILRELLFKPKARFRDLKKVDITNDHFSFHINKLVKEGLISKEEGIYSLTTRGKQFAGGLDTFSLEMEKQAKTAVAIHAVREKAGKREYLVHQRLKEPFYEWYGSHSGKIKWGENPLGAAKREFMEEVGLTGDFTLKGIARVAHTHKSGHFLEDKYFWVYLVENVAGDFMEETEEGKNIWVTEKEYRALDNKFATFEEMIEVLDSDSLIYVERDWKVSSY